MCDRGRVGGRKWLTEVGDNVRSTRPGLVSAVSNELWGRDFYDREEGGDGGG